MIRCKFRKEKNDYFFQFPYKVGPGGLKELTVGAELCCIPSVFASAKVKISTMYCIRDGSNSTLQPSVIIISSSSSKILEVLKSKMKTPTFSFADLTGNKIDKNDTWRYKPNYRTVLT